MHLAARKAAIRSVSAFRLLVRPVLRIPDSSKAVPFTSPCTSPPSTLGKGKGSDGGILTSANPADSLRRRSPFSVTTIIMVGAMVEDGGGSPQCSLKHVPRSLRYRRRERAAKEMS